MSDRLIILRDGSPLAVPVGTIYPERGLIGEIKSYAGISLPTGFLWCDGSAISAVTYNTLLGVIGGAFGFNVTGTNFISAVSGSSTLTAASSSPTLGSWILLSGAGTIFNFTMPPGLNNRNFVPLYVLTRPTSTTFTVSLTESGPALVASATGSGGVSAYEFILPDLRGRVPVGRDNMGGSAADRLESLASDGELLGETGGADTHTLDTTEIPAHTHTVNNASHLGFVGSGGAATVSGGSTFANSSTSLNSAGGGGAHNNLAPLQIVNYIVRAL